MYPFLLTDGHEKTTERDRQTDGQTDEQTNRRADIPAKKRPDAQR